MQAIALHIGQQALRPYGVDGPLSRSQAQRRVTWTRERQGLFGTWTKETVTIEIEETHWLDRPTGYHPQARLVTGLPSEDGR